MADIVVSDYKNTPVIAALIDNKLEYLSFVRKNSLKDIYLGKVDNIVKNINAAFIKIGDVEIGYLPIKNITSACVTNRNFSADPVLKCGDEIIVQIDSEAIKTKKTKLSTQFSVSEKYIVATIGKAGVGASLKISEDKRNELIENGKTAIDELYPEYFEKLSGESIGIIVRTEAAFIDDDLTNILKADIRNCLEHIADILKSGKTRTIYSHLYSDNDSDSVENHINKAKTYLKTKDIFDFEIKEDSGIYGIGPKIDSLRNNKVWLKSGAYLIIEQLESFNAIDVNTGKAITGKKDIIEKVNLEAADEIMRQIRLRNLTGMILIDFINMNHKSQYNKLIGHMTKLCNQDPVHTSFIDVTGLGIMELTRNKNDKSLKEILFDIEKTVDSSKYQ